MLLKFCKLFALTAMAVTAAVAVFSYNAISEIDLSKIERRSHVIYDVNGEVIAYTLSDDTDSYRFYTRISDVSPLYIEMLIANEDHRFYDHIGVDFSALLRALFKNISSNRITSGASTIAMQVAKITAGHERTYLNKLKEVVQAVYLTQKYGRDQILEWYMTVAPFGSNIEGVKAASLKWFGHLPDKLTPSEAAFLTALPRAPEHIRPDRNHKATLYYKNEVLRLSYEKGVISRDVWQASIQDDLPAKQFVIPMNSLTLGNYLFPRIKDREIYTYLSSENQKLLQQIAATFHEDHNDGAVLSAVILDSATHRVTGILGSSDLKTTQMCLPFAQRSPGSTLKPFAYALAFQERKLHPNTLLHDNSKLFDVWNPANYSGTFSGKVTAAKALTSSLNLPALEVIGMVGPQKFINTFNSGRKRIFVKDNAVDYSVILGSPTITLMDLANLYTMLNEDGVLNSFALYRGEPREKPVAMLSEDSARITYEILKTTHRPYNAIGFREVSYKTGTSSKFTDALSVGSYMNNTVAVAIRFPDNKPGAYRYAGYKDAAPILFNILANIRTSPFSKKPLASDLFTVKSPEALTEAVAHEKTVDRHALRIIFPSNNDTVMPDYNGRVFIKYTGGEGKIYLTAGERQYETDYFEPEQEGLYNVSLMDENGRSDSISFRVVFGSSMMPQ